MERFTNELHGFSLLSAEECETEQVVANSSAVLIITFLLAFYGRVISKFSGSILQ